jgi:hypothetical protein
VSSKHSLSQPGLFADLDEIRQTQRAVLRYATEAVPNGGNDMIVRNRIIEDERELRYRALAKSAVLWAVVGIPLLMAVVTALLFVFAGIITMRA